MATITTRAGKGSPLTNTEVDDNFSNLNSAKYESGATPTFGNVAAGAELTLSSATSLLGANDTGLNHYSNNFLYLAGGSAGLILKGQGLTPEYVRFAADTVFNDDSLDRDFRVESNDNANMLFVDAGTNRVGIGMSAPESLLHLYETSSATGQITLSTLFNAAEHNAGRIGWTHASGWNTTIRLGTASGHTALYRDELIINRDYVVFNEDSNDTDFRVESNSNAHAFFLDAGNNVIGTGTSTPATYVSGGGLAIKGATASDLALVSSGVASGVNSHQIRYWNDTGTAYEIARTRINVGAGQVNRGEYQFAVNNGALLRPWLDVDYGGNVVFNQQGYDSDFRVESDSNSHMLFVDAGANTVGINASLPRTTLHVNVDGATGGTTTDWNNDKWFLIADGSGASDSGFGITHTAASGTWINSLDPYTSWRDIIVNGDNFKYFQGGSREIMALGYSEAVFNDGSVDLDFRVESNDHTSMLHVDAFQNRVGLRLGAPQATLDVAGPIIAGDGGATGGGMLIAHRYGGGEYYSSDFLGSIGSEYSSGNLVIGYGARAAKSLAESNADHRMYSTYDNFAGQKQLIVIGQHETVFNFSNAAASDTVEDGIDSHNSFEVHRNYVLVNKDSRDDVDFRVESDSNAYMLFVDASTNRVGIGASPNSTLSVSNTTAGDGGSIADFVGSDNNQRLIVANFTCGTDEDRVGLIWENQGSVLLRQWMADTGQLYVSGGTPANQIDGDRIIKDQANIGGTGDRGISIPNGDRFGFDETGTRSWTMKATGGNLTVNSGDGNGQTDVNMNLYTSKDLTVNGATHQLGEYVSALHCTFLRSEYFVRGLRGEVLKVYSGHQISWNTSTEVKSVFEVSHDSANWGTKFIVIEVFQTMYGGGGYTKYYLRHQYGSNTLYLISQHGSDVITTASMTGLTTVTGNVKKSTFQLTMGYYQHAMVRVSSNMTAVSSITGQDQLHFL